jgi:hypothetical protein
MEIRRQGDWGARKGNNPRLEITGDAAPVRTSRSSLGACLGGKFVLARAEEAYEAQAGGPNRKFRFNPNFRSSMQDISDGLRRFHAATY